MDYANCRIWGFKKCVSAFSSSHFCILTKSRGHYFPTCICRHWSPRLSCCVIMGFTSPGFSTGPWPHGEERFLFLLLFFFIIKWDCRDPATPRIAHVYTGPDSPLGGHACVRVCAPHLTDLARQRGFTAGRSARPQAD